MKAGTLFTLVAFTGIATAMLKITTSYRLWKQNILDNLQMNSRIANTIHGPIEYNISGDRSGSIILISHGTPAGYDQSIAFASLFRSKHITTISISRPGYLRTPLAHNETPEAQADLYAALLDKLDIEQVTMLGMSGGGPSALQFALRHSERCKELVLLCAVTRSYDESGRIKALPLLPRFVRQYLIRFISADIAYFLLAIRARWFHTPVSEQFYCSYTCSELRNLGYQNDIKHLLHLQNIPLECITTPTLILHGNSDDNVPLEYAKYAVAHIPNAQLIIDEGGDHDFFMKHKERVLPIIEAFVEPRFIDTVYDGEANR